MRVGVFVVASLLAVACGSRSETGGAATASPSSITATATATATASPATSPSPTATPKPNPTAGPGTYTSLAYGYRVELPAGWRRSACQSTRDPSQPPGVETFTNATVEAETGTDTGPANDVVVMRVEPNPTGMTALGWLESGKMGFSTGSRFEQISFDGNPDAARIVTTDGTRTLAIVVNARFRIYAVNRGMREPSPASEAQAGTLMGSLHILRDAELADARATLATPSPAPARTAESVAETVARGFAQKDTALLATVADACLTRGVESGGAGFASTAKTLGDLQRSFSSGLVAAVQATPLVDRTADYAAVMGTWQEPGQPAKDVKHMIMRVGSTWYWSGWIDLQPRR